MFCCFHVFQPQRLSLASGATDYFFECEPRDSSSISSSSTSSSAASSSPSSSSSPLSYIILPLPPHCLGSLAGVIPILTCHWNQHISQDISIDIAQFKLSHSELGDQDAKFKTFGCGSAIASSSYAGCPGGSWGPTEDVGLTLESWNPWGIWELAMK